MARRAAASRSTGGTRKLCVLFTCAGRRVELIDGFRAAARREKLALTVLTTDQSTLAPAMHLADTAILTPPTRSRQYLPVLCSIVEKHRVDLLVPTIDPDLLPLARARDALASRGCRVVISSPTVIRTCRDKLRTSEFLCRNGIDTPQTWLLDDVLARRRHAFPYFIKPRTGSASRGSYKVADLDALRFLGQRVPAAIVQEFVDGTEITLDVYAGLDGVPRCVVPRQRLAVRGGEVTKSRIVKDPALIEIGCRVVTALGACVGGITIQCIVDRRRRIRIIEINPRFGGGLPLSIHAGADFPRWLLAEHRGRRPRIRLDGYSDGLCMLRYDRSVFTDGDPGWPQLP